MKPFIHAKNSAKKYGGEAEDYLEIHNFIDSSKVALGDVRHRALLHNTFGIFMVEKLFGPIIVNSAGKKVSTRDIAEDHVVEDMGFIPTIENWLEHIPLQDWMVGGRKKKDPSKTTFIIVD
jgi:hypothetical protein